MLTKIYSSVYRRANKAFQQLTSYDVISGNKIHTLQSLIRIGSENGGWVIPDGIVETNSICYCVGVGEDITFDLGLIDRYKCDVYSYDPTPRSKEHVEKVAKGELRYKYKDVGLWDRDEVLKFYAPKNTEHVSHSILNLQNTDHYFEAKCKRLSNIMKENNHTQIDLLKLDIEGAEYKVIDSIIEDNLDIKVLCVEYDEVFNSLDNRYRERIMASVNKVIDHGFKIVCIDEKGNYTFVHKSVLASAN